MRTFEDQAGKRWTADVEMEDGPDYKGQYFLVMKDEEGKAVALTDVRWNSERTARRTLETMAISELRRRLRTAVARGTSPAAA